MDYKNKSLPIEQRVEHLLSLMTVKEKISQLNMLSGASVATKPSPLHACSVEDESDYHYEDIAGIFQDRSAGFVHDTYSTPAVLNKIQRYWVEETRLGIPCIFTAEALHGITGLRGTVFPVPLAMAASFHPELVEKIGQAIASETRSLGMQEILAPNLDIAREPRWGRVEETFGEDTHLASRMGVSIIKGAQQRGNLQADDAVAVEPKHYCVHGIPERGSNCAPARAGKREIHSCHLPVFEAAVKEGGARNVMASYNSIDGDVMMCSHEYLTEILKENWGATGYVRSDWGGIGKIMDEHKLVRDRKSALKLAICNGLDTQGLDYDNKMFEDLLEELVEEGQVPLSRLNDAVARVLRLKFELGLFERPYTQEDLYQSRIRCENHLSLSLQSARESIVLLKNEGNILPLSEKISSIALIGPSSSAQKIGGYSSIPTGYSVKSVFEELKEALGENVTLRQCDGCSITDGKNQPRFIDGQAHLQSNSVEEANTDFQLAEKIAKESDLVILVLGDNTVTSGEGQDRTSLVLAGKQRELVKMLSKLGKPLVLVLENGKPVDLEEEEPLCAAILSAWFGGELGAKAIVETLLGQNNPSGRLPISFPRRSTALPCYYSMLSGGSYHFYEGDATALYPFGFGLSYTSFQYKNMNVIVENQEKYQVKVTADITNTGPCGGTEIVQLYLDDLESSVVTPPLLLKGFQRVSLKKGETKEVSFQLDFDSFKLLDIHYHWTVEPGEFNLILASSSRKQQLSQIISLP